MAEECFLSEDCTSAMDPRLLAPHLQGVLSMLAATAFASVYIFTVGGGITAIQNAARDREWQLVLISLSIVSSHLLGGEVLKDKVSAWKLGACVGIALGRRATASARRGRHTAACRPAPVEPPIRCSRFLGPAF